MFTRCGAEISVASTKAFTAQALNLYLLHLALAQKEGSLSHRLLQEKLTTLTQLPNHMETIISQSEHIRAVAHYLTGYDHIFFLGRHYQLPIAYEIALKLKEIAYIHTEAYPAGELKHGPLALIDEKFLSILLMPDDGFLDSNRSTLHEIQARGGKVLVISDTPIPEADRQITIPSIDVELIPLLTNVV
ncbi:MAG: SIS domain-containing protein [Candidatus Peribacteria bacterium]|nr:MAG: SIS domain-containing protein [Candidatus Peribacteria bacterium]